MVVCGVCAFVCWGLLWCFLGWCNIHSGGGLICFWICRFLVMFWVLWVCGFTATFRCGFG